MASHRGAPVEDDDHNGRNPYASANRWRHAESSAFARYEKDHPSGPVARDANARGGGVNDLADFLNTSRIQPSAAGASRPTTPRFKPVVAGASEARAATSHGAAAQTAPQQRAPDGKDVVCGPLLNYRRMEGLRWFGSVLVVVAGGGARTQPFVPTLSLRQVGGGGGGSSDIQGTCLYSDVRNTFWRFNVEVGMEPAETRWEYELPGLRFVSETKPRVNSFFVPAIDESMRVMFHSCNGFSVGTDEAAWSGPALWNDVMRRHRERPFHVMIGGGDQIYNDGVRVSGPLRPWSDMANPKKRRDHPFPESLRQECDDYYLRNYLRWYATEPFAAANGQIPQLNIWDDHDIIDGFGSYVDDFMKCDVFRGIGGTAHKYYMLFQHHLPPPASTYTSDAVPAVSAEEAQGVEPNQSMNAYVHPQMTEPSYIYGQQPGPYVSEHSHNMFARLGARIAFLGIDARTERTRHRVNYDETYNQIFTRLKQELSDAASSGRPFKHLILLLGIPIAYPRLTWLENIFASPLMGPIKLLNRRVGIGGSFFNTFDGSVDLLDDLDDHYTARTHKKERNWLVEKLQGICAEFSIRITIVGGDVHLAAVGRFYSNPRLNVPVEQDYRYMVNVISSAIVNKPPPAAVANLLARRNKIHHLNDETDETLLKLFDKDPGESCRTASGNHVTMPSRNFAMITENSPNAATTTTTTNGAAALRPNGPTPTEEANPLAAAASASINNPLSPGPQPQTDPVPVPPPTKNETKTKPTRDGRLPLHAGEANCGTKHRAATAHGRGGGGAPPPAGSLDVCICVEVDQHDPRGRTEGYGLTIPALQYAGPMPPTPPPPPVAMSTRTGSRGSRGSAG